MMHVPTGPDGERKRSWMTAGVLCVHGAEQGEALYSIAQLSPSLSFFSISPLFSLTHSHTTSGVLSGAVTLYKSPLSQYSHTVTLEMVCYNASLLSPPFLHSLFESLSLSSASFSVSLSLSTSIFVRNKHCIFRLTALRCRSLRQD